ncbi:MAG: TonB-dependent outer membrane protein SusC/RagA [Gemmatimonadetes bacterium]|nr:TonB-dependent outer membrane protein SusC/RagA [Gemmatimonadota bacterium]
MSKFRWLVAMLIAVAVAPGSLLAQEPATITGRVTNASGNPEAAVLVRIDALNVGTATAADGTYRLVVPASRVRAGQQVRLTASRVGLAPQSRMVTLSPGASLSQNFQLGADVLVLSEIVATGQQTATTRERLTTAVSTVRAQEIQRAREPNVVEALAGKAPGVQVTSSSGDPGAGAYIQIRGSASVVGGTQPLFVVDGTPIDNSTNVIEDQPVGGLGGNITAGGTGGGTTGTSAWSGASAINPNDIERVEILKGAAATAIYGARGANGVILITTKSGKAGSTRATYSFSFGQDHVTSTVPLQQQFGQGSGGNTSKTTSFSWGAPIAAGTPVFNHATELYQNANRFENNATLSGGSERTTYYLSLGRLSQAGVIVGPQAFSRTNVRLKGTHFFTDQIQVGGNVAYTRTDGDFVQQGSNTSGIQLGALRTPPDFNNLPYIDPATGLHRSYRCNEVVGVCPGGNPFSDILSPRGYDNPFWVANELTNTGKAGRAFGNVSLDYTPTSWLRVSYLLGTDYTSDERMALFPKSSSSYSDGAVIRANFVTDILDSNLTATATGHVGSDLVGSLTVGQNLNQQDFRQNQTNGTTLINGTEETNFAVTNVGNEFKYRTRTDGYFANGEATFHDMFTVNATARWDGSSTFGGSGKRFFYPGVGASWVFTKLGAFDNLGFLDLGKVRASYGVSGRQPPVFSNVSAYTTGTFIDGWLTSGLYSIYNGLEGVRSQFRLGNANIRPEKKREFELGTDLAFLNQRVSTGITYYRRKTTDAILSVGLPYSSGYNSIYDNVAAFDNHGWEATLSVTPVKTSAFNWTMDAQYSQNRSCVTDLHGSESVFLNGFTGSTVSLVGPDVAGGCQPFGVFYGDDFVRFGRGSVVDEGGHDVDIDATYHGANGVIYVGPNGLPLLDPQSRVLGDPNPKWLGSLRSTFTLFNNLTISGLLDVKHGGQIWNGTKGALTYFGTHGTTAAYHGAGVTQTYAQFSGQPVAGPGAQTATLFDQNWYTSDIGSGFTGPSVQFIEDGGFVKLRDISLSYTVNRPELKRLGFSTMDLTVSGRNLKTWTNYTGIDPESNLTGQSTGRGLDYFNNPQTRTFAVSVNLSR